VLQSAKFFFAKETARMLLAMIFLAGVLHGLGPDHLAAITALNAASGAGSRRLLFFSTRFALGHAAVLAVAGLATHFLRVSMPAAWEHGFELATAWLLLVSGAAMLLALASGRLTVHSHPHQHAGGAHRHLHAHLLGARQHRHAHGNLAATLGGLFALSGARSLLAVVPAALAQTPLISFLRVGIFSAGIFAGMLAYGLVAGRALRRLERPVDAPAPGGWFTPARAAFLLSGALCLAAGIAGVAGILPV
jgi:ABC-type nickel/cobalt efflux system permease component RcnA